MNLNTYLAQQDAAAAAQVFFDEILPGWEDRERFGDTLLDERDFALDTPDADAVSDEDWAVFAEAMYADPAERF